MNLSIIVLKQTIMMFLLMTVGYILFKIKIISSICSKELSKMLITLVIPCVVIKSYAAEFSPEKLNKLIEAFLACLLALIIAMLICHLLYGKRKVIDNFGVSFSNAGFMGIPLVGAVLGSEAVFFVSCYVALLNFLQQTYGVYVITRDSSYISLKKALLNPILIALVTGIVLFVTPLQLPSMVLSGIDSIAGLNTPIAMMVLGVYLAQSDIKEVLLNCKLYASSTARLLLIPIITILIFRFVPIARDIKMIELIAAATPVGSNVAVFAQLHDKDYKYAAQLVCNSTIFSIVTLPLIVLIASSLI